MAHMPVCALRCIHRATAQCPATVPITAYGHFTTQSLTVHKHAYTHVCTQAALLTALSSSAADVALARQADDLALDIRRGIEEWGVVTHSSGARIFAMEVVARIVIIFAIAIVSLNHVLPYLGRRLRQLLLRRRRKRAVAPRITILRFCRCHRRAVPGNAQAAAQ